MLKDSEQLEKINVLHIVSNISIRNGIMSVLMNYYRHINTREIQFSFLYFDVRQETYEVEILKLGGAIYKTSRKSFLKDWQSFCKHNYQHFNILHNHELYLSAFFINAKKELGNKILISHAHATRFADNEIKGIRNRLLSYPAKKISDCFLACSNDAGVALFQRHYVLKGYLLYNAINVERFTFNSFSRQRIRNELGIRENQYVIGHVGNFTPQKNHKKIVQIFKECLNEKPDAKLLLVGDGYLRDEIENYARELRIIENIIFLGVKNNVEDYLSAMDVYVFPSLFEGLGIALVEAQTNGLTCVFSDVVPNEANILKEKNVCLSLNESPALWAQHILMAETSRSQVYNEVENAGYDISKEAMKLVQFYRDILVGNDVISLRKGTLNEI